MSTAAPLRPARHRTHRGLAIVVTVVALLAGFAPPAAAGTGDVVRTPYSGTDHKDDDSCGYATTVDTTYSGVVSLRRGKGPQASFFFRTDRFEFSEVHTVTATNEKFVIRGKGQSKDVRATPLGDNRFEVITTQSNQPIVVEDSDGKVVARAFGTVRFHYVVDTLGDNDPDTTEFVEFLGQDGTGQYPGRSTCNLAAKVVGTGSAKRLTAHPLGTTPSPMGYYEYLPPGYRKGGRNPSRAPLLIFLHGYGGSGNGSPEQLPAVIDDTAIPFYIANNGWPRDRPFVVLAPQHADVPSDKYPYPCDGPWGGSCVARLQHQYGNPLPAGSPCITPSEVEAFLDYALATYAVDPSRVYLTGLSCGGYGVWESLAQWAPGRIAAAVPIAGEGRPAVESAGCRLAAVPIWAFHGDADDTVDPLGSIDAVARLQACPDPHADVKLTVYPKVGHESWNPAYTGSKGDIYGWMLSKTTAGS